MSMTVMVGMNSLTPICLLSLKFCFFPESCATGGFFLVDVFFLVYMVTIFFNFSGFGMW